MNDATALLIYRLAVGAAITNSFALSAVAPTFLLGVAGSLIVGPAFAWIFLAIMRRVHHVPSAIILQFVTTFGLAWVYARYSAAKLDPLARQLEIDYRDGVAKK